MSLYNLKREYEERRQALVDQLQKNANLDPATQHQIYGAIKEIENFLKTIEYQISSEQEKNINVALSNDRPRPATERTSNAVYHVARGTKKIFTHHIPGAIGKVVGAPKVYFDKKREEARMRAEIAAEVKARHEAHQQQLAHTTEHITLEHPHQELAAQHVEELPAPQMPEQTLTHEQEVPFPTWTDDVPMKDETVQRKESEWARPAASKSAGKHFKRPKVIQKSSKTKNHPSKNAPGKKGGQHKPHLKADKYSRKMPKKRR